MTVRALPPLAALLLVSPWVAAAAPVARDAPTGGATTAPQAPPAAAAPVDPARRYLFYLHGAWLEHADAKREHPVHGRYRYDDIVQAFTERGFSVLSEVRGPGTRVPEYAQKVADRARELLKAGVPPGHISVVGHSKGGSMTLLTSTLLQEPGMHFVVLAGCGRPGSGFGRYFDDFVTRRASHLRGRILSLYDESDRVAGSCRRAFERAPQLESDELVLRTGRGHGLFFSPDPLWIDPVVDWAGG